MSRLSIYQLFVRHFANFSEKQVVNGTLEQNGCGKFNDITDLALQCIADMGINTVWFTGVIEHATGGLFKGVEPDPPSILKGEAGSPYAIKDYYDVAPSLATEPANRLAEFAALIGRTHAAGLRCVIDFVPNHVARSYRSSVYPERDFGKNDSTESFFDRENDFYYLQEETRLSLPNGSVFQAKNSAPRVSGNNVLTASPSKHDWYETVKLNYGYDFRDPSSLNELNNQTEVPPLWHKMRDILMYWAEMGVDGVRCDMAHMVPVAFWKWVTSQVREKYPEFIFLAEAYAGDPMGCLPNKSLNDLIEAGIDACYDQDFYHQLKAATEGHLSTDSLSNVFFDSMRQFSGIRYIENHDEVRVANPNGFGADAQNMAACAAAWLTGTGPIMLYNGQEVAEPAIGEAGFSGDDGRSSIFDYIALPEFQKWTNGGAYDGAQLSLHQRLLRSKYVALVRLAQKEEFMKGDTFGLNYLNPQLAASRTFAFLRYLSGEECVLVVCCFAERVPETISVKLSPDVFGHLKVDASKLWQGMMAGEVVKSHTSDDGTTWLDVSMQESVNVICASV